MALYSYALALYLERRAPGVPASERCRLGNRPEVYLRVDCLACALTVVYKRLSPPLRPIPLETAERRLGAAAFPTRGGRAAARLVRRGAPYSCARIHTSAFTLPREI